MASTLIALLLAAAAGSPSEKESRCAADLIAGGSAFGNHDYAAAEAAFERSLETCAEVEPGPKARSERLESIADAQLHQQRWEIGLATTDRCLRAWQANHTCHFYRWFALRKLNRTELAEAEKVKARAALEAFLALEPAQGVSPFQRKRLESKQESARSFLQVVMAAR